MTASEFDGLRDAASRFFQSQRDVAANICATTLLSSATATKQIAKYSTGEHVAKGFKDILNIGEMRCATIHSLMAKLIVARPLLRIAQDLVSFSGFLEFLGRPVVARIGVRMEFHRQLTI